MSHSSAELQHLRRLIDELDGQLLELLAARVDKVKAVGQYKRAHELPPLDEQRWQSLIQARLETARSLGLSEDFVTKLYDLIHEYALQLEAGDKS